MEERNYFVYILTNYRHTVLYIGMTNNLQRRIYEHREKLVDGFTKKYNLNKLVYFEIFHEVTDAFAREKELKGWRRSKKDNLINKNNPNRKNLWWDIIE